MDAGDVGLVDGGERLRSAVFQPLFLLWKFAPRKMRTLILRGLACRLLQSLCLAGVYGAVAVCCLLLVSDMVTSFALIPWAALACVVLLILQFWFAYSSVRCIWLTSFRLVGAIRHRLLRNLLHLPLAFHLSCPRGDLANALTSDLALVENFLTDGLPRLVHSLGLPFFVLLLIGIVDPPTAFVALLPMMAMLPMLYVSSRHLARLSGVKQLAQATATSQILQWVEGMATVRAFNLLDRQAGAFTAPLADIHRVSVHMVTKLTAPLLGFSAVVMSGVALIVAIAGYRHGSGQISTGQVVAILVLAYPLCVPLLGLTQFMELATVAHGAMARLHGILAAEKENNAIGIEPLGHSLTFEAVGFCHSPARQVLTGVSFQLPERGLTAIVGRSGAGKSTILNLAAGLFQPAEGRVLIGGRDMRSISPSSISRLVSVMFQDVQLFSGSINDNIAMGNHRASRLEIERAAEAAGAHAFIEALPDGYETILGESGITLSGGERQRISLARALLKDSPILLIDEGTASVDPLTEHQIGDTLKQLSVERSLIVVTHRLPTMRAAEHIVVIDDGRVVAIGTHAQLSVSNDLYQSLSTKPNGASRPAPGDGGGGHNQIRTGLCSNFE